MYETNIKIQEVLKIHSYLKYTELREAIKKSKLSLEWFRFDREMCLIKTDGQLTEKKYTDPCKQQHVEAFAALDSSSGVCRTLDIKDIKNT